jgi:hypothetical protein
LTTPVASKPAVASKLSFTPAATTPAAAGGTGAEAASPALSPLWGTPAAGGSKTGGAGSSPLFQMQANPLFGTSPGQAKSPLAAVPAPAINMAAAAAAAAGKPPHKPASKGGQPPEPPAMLQQAASRQVGCAITPVTRKPALLAHSSKHLTCACAELHFKIVVPSG